MVLGALPVLLALCCLSFAASAEAGEVHFDPGSPAGKEYALPLQQARNEALGAGGGESAGGSSGAAPLFGVGVRGEPGARQGPGSNRISAGRQPASAPPSTSRSAPATRHAASGPPTKGPGATGSSYPAGQAALILLGLLLLGVVSGLGLRAWRVAP